VVRFDDINWDGKPIAPEQEPSRALLAKYGNDVDGVYLAEAAYAQSKTANILFTVHLNHGLRKRGVVSYAVNPRGTAHSNSENH
jgi:NAD(P)-dependent dehydrogenase (short-subunit alcohol dehydrogenase family)